MSKNLSVSIIGSGYVGLSLAVAFCEVGIDVFCVEKDKKLIARIKSGKAHFYEEGFDKILAKHINNKRLKISTNSKNIKNYNYKIVTIGTPLKKDMNFSLQSILGVIKNIYPYINKNDTIILRSTVGIGTTRKIANIIKKQLVVNICYCPERVVAGKMLEELSNLPQIISGIDKNSEKSARKLFSKITNKIVLSSSTESAELTKLINNTYRDFHFAFANFVALASDNLQLNPHEVIETCNKGYLRSSIPSPGLVGGSCLEKDPYILAASLNVEDNKKSISNKNVVWSRSMNEKFFNHLLLKFKKLYKKNTIDICILGGAFKAYPKTDDIRGSYVMPLIEWFRNNYKNPKIRVFDKIASKYHKDKVIWSNEILETLKSSEVIIVQTNNKAHSSKSVINYLIQCKSKKFIIDYWGIFRDLSHKFPKNIVIIRYGH